MRGVERMTFAVLKTIAMFLSGVLNIIWASEESLKPVEMRRPRRRIVLAIVGVALIGLAVQQVISLA